MATIPYAELHAHTNFTFLDGASPADELVERAVELGLTGLAVTDRNGLYGAVRFMGAAEEAGLHGVVGAELDQSTLPCPIPTASCCKRDGGAVGAASPPGPSDRSSRVVRLVPGRSGRNCRAAAIRSRRTCAGSANGPAART